MLCVCAPSRDEIEPGRLGENLTRWLAWRTASSHRAYQSASLGGMRRHPRTKRPRDDTERGQQSPSPRDPSRADIPLWFAVVSVVVYGALGGFG